jgi:hypothetical protein
MDVRSAFLFSRSIQEKHLIVLFASTIFYIFLNHTTWDICISRRNITIKFE